MSDRPAPSATEDSPWGDDRPGPGPFVALVGLRAVAVGDGHCAFDLALEPRHMNPYGVVHGGVVYSLVDTAMGGALLSRLVPGERCATLEIKLNYVAPASSGVIRADARVVERTKRIAVLEARVQHDTDRVIALATGTFYIQGPSS